MAELIQLWVYFLNPLEWFLQEYPTSSEWLSGHVLPSFALSLFVFLSSLNMSLCLLLAQSVSYGLCGVSNRMPNTQRYKLSLYKVELSYRGKSIQYFSMGRTYFKWFLIVKLSFLSNLTLLMFPTGWGWRCPATQQAYELIIIARNC